MLIREALHPYPGMLVATKAGLTRSGPNQWSPKGDPDYLIGEAKRSCEKLGVQQIGLWQLHRIDSRIDRGEQLGRSVPYVRHYAPFLDIPGASPKWSVALRPVAGQAETFRLAS